MENQITCPNCRKRILNNPLVGAAVKGEGAGSESFIHDCGEKITYWQITAQLRDQKKLMAKFRGWLHSFSKS